ncbi:MAG: ESPR-type extended signal peptide-containing protein, partial [Noviherbaspirillum sp.]
MNRIYRLVWNKKRNMLIAVSEAAAASGKKAGGETGDGKPGRRERQALPGGAAILAAAVFSAFPLASFAQQTYTFIDRNEYLSLIDDGVPAPGQALNADAANWMVINDGILDIAETGNGSQIQSLSGSGAVLLGGQTLTLTNASDVFAGTAFGGGGLTIAGGAQTLSGATHHTGATSIGEGAWLSLSGSGGIADSFRLVDDGMFDISATSAGASIQSLSGSGAVLLGDQTLTLTNASDVFAGTVFGSGGLTIAGGAQTLSGATHHTGATSIGEGAWLSLSGSGGIADSF